MTEKDKIIQDLQLENDRLMVRLAELSGVIEEQERRLQEIREEADRFIKEKDTWTK